MFPTDALDPSVTDHVLRIVNSEKTEVKVASVENGGHQNAEANDGDI
jgi:hypothetical protein